MRNILVVLLVSVLGNAAFSQAYTPFISADSSDVWKQYKGYAPYAEDINDYEQVFRINGDTMINGNNYAAFWGNYFYHWWDSFSYNPAPDIYEYGEVFIGGIREANKQIFFIYFDSTFIDSTEHLIYDFNLEVGDTVPNASDCHWYNEHHCLGGFNSGDTEELIIHSIDSMLIGTTYRKRFNLPYDKWIVEGIGASTGLLHSITQFLSGWNNLWCYREQGITLYSYPFGGASSCVLDMGVNQNIAEIDLQIFPNPVKAGEKLKVVLESGNTYDIEVFDLLGKNIYSSTEANGTATISTDMEKGVYLIRVSTSKGTAVQRLVVY